MMTLIYILQVLVGFGFIIFIHEMGHFLAAKKVGIRVHAFSVGFPAWLPFVKIPERWMNIVKVKWGETEYRLGWVPFGGYVQMQGQADSPGQMDAATKDDKGDYRNKGYWQKTLVLWGGVTMNAITAIVFFILAFQIGVTFIEPTVGAVSPQSKAWMENEVQVGDHITKVNGRNVDDFEDVVYAGIFDGGDKINIEVERKVDGKTVSKSIDIPLDKNDTFGLMLPGIGAKRRVVIEKDEADRFPASLGDNRPQEGDEIVAINGRPVLNEEYAVGNLAVSRGEVELTLRRGTEKEWKVNYTPARHFTSGAGIGGFTAGMGVVPAPYVSNVRRNGAGDKAGLRKGDRIVGYRADGGEAREIGGFAELTMAVDESKGRNLTLIVERDGGRIELPSAPTEKPSTPGRYELAISISNAKPPAEADKPAEMVPPKEVKIYAVRPGSVAEKAGVKVGDIVTGAKVGGEPILNKENKDGGFDLGSFGLTFISAYDDATRKTKEVTLTLKRGEETQTVSFTPDVDGPESVAFMKLSVAEQRSAPVRYGIGEAITQGFHHSKKVAYKIIMTLGGLFTGKISVTHLGGPIVIAKRSYSLAGWGAGTLIFFLAFISLNLAIVNLLPIPVLDGGQWLIVTIEKIAGRPIPAAVMNVVGLVSFIFVLGLMLFVLGNDIVTVLVRKWV
ncbi:MAG: site-2 protease family protein [Planctomycetes bacterium]|nr:site-2 protease family protein [Planctomycetota bacterium]